MAKGAFELPFETHDRGDVALPWPPSTNPCAGLERRHVSACTRPRSVLGCGAVGRRRTIARPKKHPDEKRSERLNLRFTVAERGQIETQARIAGLELFEFARRRVLNYVVPTAPTRHSDPALVSELARVGNNINQLARMLHRGRELPEYWRELGEQLQDVLAKIVVDDP